MIKKIILFLENTTFYGGWCGFVFFVYIVLVKSIIPGRASGSTNLFYPFFATFIISTLSGIILFLSLHRWSKNSNKLRKFQATLISAIFAIIIIYAYIFSISSNWGFLPYGNAFWYSENL